MAESVSSLLASWSSYFVIVGSSAAALTGLMFVVITIVMGTERLRRSPDGVSTFSTPTVVHFGAALLISAILSAPWHSLDRAATIVGLVGLGGILYVLRIMYRAKRLREYAADLEDWIWYGILPFVAYGAVFAGALDSFVFPAPALFAIAGAALVLVFVGIHNAWDIVTFIAMGNVDEPPK